VARKANTPAPLRIGFRITDQESARVVAIHRPNGQIVGSGCLVDHRQILTCRHVVAAALAPEENLEEQQVLVSLVGVTGQPTIKTKVAQIDKGRLSYDLARLEIMEDIGLEIVPVMFASPFRHGGKSYSVLGFPGGDPQGRNASGHLHAADAAGLVQMDGSSSLFVRGGFSGAPVWSTEVDGFVGLVVTEQANFGVSWCIPSRVLCTFYPKLAVRFRMPLQDRPVINDFDNDDPNARLFGTISDNGQYKLTAKISGSEGEYTVKLKYECLANSAPQGHWVTFITHPSFTDEDEDAYELFAELENGVAREKIEPHYLFTVAAIGNGGEIALTLDLQKQWEKAGN
jgi:hypothetical protein